MTAGRHVVTRVRISHPSACQKGKAGPIGRSIQMKPYMHVLFLTIGGASLLLMTSCRAISTTHTQDIGGPRFTPSDPAKIEILQNVPARPHVEVGKVWGHSSDTSVDVSKLED